MKNYSMKNFKIFLLISACFCNSVLAQQWHVAVNGNDTFDGKTIEKAFRTLQKAAAVVKPGDTVFIGGGTYTNDDKANGSAVLNITVSGTAKAPIIWKAEPNEQPVITPKGWAGIQITGSYHIIDGLTVLGNNDAIVLIKALEEAKNKIPNPYYNSNGIVVEGRKNKPTEKPHHILIKNCTVGKCAGGGIVGLEMDYLTIEDCKVYDNAWYMRYAGSGITTLNNWAFDDAPGYHIIIQRNYVWNNKTLVPWDRIGKLSDGNGILLDVTDQEQGATNPNADEAVKKETAKKDSIRSLRPVWKGRALVANNICAFNGGSGIHTFRTSHVDIINNTTYWNGSIVGYQELFANRSDDVVILNNIIVPRPGGQVTSNNRNTNIKWDYNLYPNEQSVYKGANDIVATPLFIDLQTDIFKGNFGLQKTSNGIDQGTRELQQIKDIKRKKRLKGHGVDIGAIEN